MTHNEEASGAAVRRLAPEGAAIVFVSGNFNVLHPGHLRLLRFAKECGDFLVVGVTSNRLAGSAAMLDEKDRLEAVKANTWVNHAFILDQAPEHFVGELQPEVVVKGREHEERFNPEAEVVAQYSGQLLFGSGDTVFSAVNLLKQELGSDDAPKGVSLAVEFARRHRFSSASLDNLLLGAGSVRIAIIGDVIVDEYVSCDALGMSQEDPTLVVTPVQTKRFLGGAAIVAAHCAGLGATVDFFSVTGDDELSSYVSDTLVTYRVSAHLWKDDTRPTTLKQRIRASGKTLLRINHLRQHGIRQELQHEILERITSILERTDVFIFSDFNYGCLPQHLVDAIIMRAREKGVVLIADSQCSSQVGDVSRFKGMDLLTPTEMEARVSTRNHEDGLVVLAEKLRTQASAHNVLVKLGAEGVLVHAARHGEGDWLTDQLRAFNSQPKDTAGAGDSMLAGIAIAMAQQGLRAKSGMQE